MGLCSSNDGVGSKMKIKVVPGILEHEAEEFLKKIAKAEKFTDRVFVDIIDGRFVENLTVGMDELMELTTKLDLYVQLMTEEPINYLNQCAEASVFLVVGHIELMGNQLAFLKKGKELGMEIGLALDLSTPIDFIDESSLKKVKTILLMSVAAGFSEQGFEIKVLEKIKELREGGFQGDIFVDGGVNTDTIEKCVEAGANAFSVTSGIWKMDKPDKAWMNLKKLAQQKLKHLDGQAKKS